VPGAVTPAPGYLLHRAAKQAELVSVRVGQDHPGDIRSLTDVDPPGAQALEPAQLGIEAGAISSQVQVQAVLHGLGLGHDEDVQCGMVCAGRAQADALLAVFYHLPSEDGGPKGSHGTRIDGVDAHGGDASSHGLILPPGRDPR